MLAGGSQVSDGSLDLVPDAFDSSDDCFEAERKILMNTSLQPLLLATLPLLLLRRHPLVLLLATPASARADRTSTGPDPEWSFISDFSSLAPTTSVLTLPVTAIVNILPPLSDPLVVRGLATDRAGGCR